MFSPYIQYSRFKKFNCIWILLNISGLFDGEVDNFWGGGFDSCALLGDQGSLDCAARRKCRSLRQAQGRLFDVLRLLRIRMTVKLGAGVRGVPRVGGL